MRALWVASAPAPGDAREAARRAAGAAGVECKELRDMDEVRRATAVFDSIWGERAQVSAELAIAMAHSDNYVAAAASRSTGRLVGTLVGFRGVLEDGEPYLHSHILGVLPGAATRGVGCALKLHQRAWALDRGLQTIGWTFDPLVARNAYFNVTKLGVDVVKYCENFYGRMNDAQNGHDDSDRILALWRLASKRARRAAAGQQPALSASAAAGAEVILAVGPADEPVFGTSGAVSGLVSIQIPGDIIGVRRDAPELAGRWRRAVRAALGPRLEEGFVVEGVTRAGSYILGRPGDLT